MPTAAHPTWRESNQPSLQETQGGSAVPIRRNAVSPGRICAMTYADLLTPYLVYFGGSCWTDRRIGVSF